MDPLSLPHHLSFQHHLLQPEKFWNSWSTLHVTAASPNWGRTFDCTTHNMSVFMSCSLTQLYTLCAQLWIVNVLACWPVVELQIYNLTRWDSVYPPPGNSLPLWGVNVRRWSWVFEVRWSLSLTVLKRRLKRVSKEVPTMSSLCHSVSLSVWIHALYNMSMEHMTRVKKTIRIVSTVVITYGMKRSCLLWIDKARGKDKMKLF